MDSFYFWFLYHSGYHRSFSILVPSSASSIACIVEVSQNTSFRKLYECSGELQAKYFYVAFLSQFYITAALVYLGLGGPALLFNGFQTVWSYACHTSVKWDKVLYRYRVLHPLAWLLERLLVTPATHHAHHAASHGDGVGYYKGNFGGILFIWDIIFGTAHISRKYPKQYGISNYEDDPWYAQWLWPLFKSHVIGSELAKGGPEVKEETHDLEIIKELQNA